MSVSYERDLERTVERLEEALHHIMEERCENYTGPEQWNCPAAGRKKDSEFGAERWCNSCIAAEALGLVTPPEPKGVKLECLRCAKPLFLPETEPGFVSIEPMDGWTAPPLRCPSCSLSNLGATP